MTTESRKQSRGCLLLLIASFVLCALCWNMLLTGKSLATTLPTLRNMEKTVKESLEFMAFTRNFKGQLVSCLDSVSVDRNVPQNITDPNKAALHARYTNTDPPFWISLHVKEFDATRWSIMEYGVYYEVQLGKSMVNILREQQNNTTRPLHVVDVGANIGWFTLLSIAAARQAGRPVVVDAFEPNPRNHARLCESIFLNQWLDDEYVTVNIHPVGVTSQNGGVGHMSVETSGTGSVLSQVPRQKGRYVGSNKTDAVAQKEEQTTSFPLVSLDDMSAKLGWNEHDDDQTTSFLKVDVEGLELAVFQGAKKLLQAKQFQNVFYEGNLRSTKEMDDFRAIILLFLEVGYEAYKVGGFRGPTQVIKTTNDGNAESYVKGLVEECQGGGKQKLVQCNLWWRPRRQ